MSHENVELVRGLQPGPEVDLAGMFRDDAAMRSLREATESLFSPDFECMIPSPVQDDRRYPGIEGLRTAWLDWLEPWESYRTEIEELIDAGDSVVVLTRDYGRRAGMDAEVALHGTAVWTVRAGQVARAAFYADRQQALDAAGLSDR